MLNKYPRFKGGESVKVFEKLDSKDKKIIEDFGKYCGITANENKVKDMVRDVLRLRLVVGKLDKIDLKDLRHFLYLMEKSDLMTGAKNNAKIHVQKFLRWYFDDWSKRFDEFKDIKTINGYDEEKINGKTLLTKEEIEKIIKRENSLFWKAYFLVQYEGGLRTKEARCIKWDDLKLNIDGDVSEISIYSTKTKKARSVFVKEATFYLRRLHEEIEIKSPYVFPSVEDVNKPISKFSVSRFFKSHVSKVVGRKVWAYVLRHTRARELYITNGGKIPEKTAQKFLGHKKSMVDVYSHIDNEDVKEAMSKIVYNLEDMPPEQEKQLKQEIKELKKEIVSIKEYLVKSAIGSTKVSEKERESIRNKIFNIISSNV